LLFFGFGTFTVSITDVRGFAFAFSFVMIRPVTALRAIFRVAMVTFLPAVSKMGT
jgi:hypothetical protein